MTSKWEKYKLLKKKVLPGKSEGKLPTGSHSCRRGNFTEAQLREMGCEAGKWFNLVSDRDMLPAVMMSAKSLPVPQNENFFFTGRANNDFTGRNKLGLR